MLGFGQASTGERPQDADGQTAQRGARPKIGLALGAGSARGWAHIGVLRELTAMGLAPDIIAGTSIGAVVGGCHAAGRLDEIESFALGLSRTSVLALMDWSLSGRGLISGARLRRRLEQGFDGQRIETLPVRFAAIATETGTGHEIWLTRGPLADGIRASYSLPGIFEPVRIGKSWLFDGAAVNPVPVNVCRALGADFVIAVNVIEGSRPFAAVRANELLPDVFPEEPEAAPQPTPSGGLMSAMRGGRASLLGMFRRNPDGGPSMASVMMDAFNVSQDRIARSRLAGDPPDVAIRPRLEGVGMFDFHRAADIIQSGREAALRARLDLEYYGLVETAG